MKEEDVETVEAACRTGIGCVCYGCLMVAGIAGLIVLISIYLAR